MKTNGVTEDEVLEPFIPLAQINLADIPDIVIGRLPVYLRTLKLLLDRGKEVTSSQELGELLGISSAQIRKDLSHFGEFGKQGTGYNLSLIHIFEPGIR